MGGNRPMVHSPCKCWACSLEKADSRYCATENARGDRFGTTKSGCHLPALPPEPRREPLPCPGSRYGHAKENGRDQHVLSHCLDQGSFNAVEAVVNGGRRSKGMERPTRLGFRGGADGRSAQGAARPKATADTSERATLTVTRA